MRPVKIVEARTTRRRGLPIRTIARLARFVAVLVLVAAGCATTLSVKSRATQHLEAEDKPSAITPGGDAQPANVVPVPVCDQSSMDYHASAMREARSVAPSCTSLSKREGGPWCLCSLSDLFPSR